MRYPSLDKREILPNEEEKLIKFWDEGLTPNQDRSQHDIGPKNGIMKT